MRTLIHTYICRYTYNDIMKHSCYFQLEQVELENIAKVEN